MTTEYARNVENQANDQNDPREDKVETDASEKAVGRHAAVAGLLVVLVCSASAHTRQTERVYKKE